MIGNAAFLAALTTFLLAGWIASELTYLAPYKAGIFREHGTVIGVCVGAVFFNLCAVFYNVGRWLFLRDAGRKLSHLDRQLRTRDAVLHDLQRDLKM